MRACCRWESFVAVLGVALAAWGCRSEPPRASAARINSRSQLIGGPRALGEVGDFKLGNGIIQAIIQDVGSSRGFGAFGGSLIDLDLVRGDRGGGDYFTELFPAFFLQAIEPASVEVVSDGSDGSPAVVRVSGPGGQFLSQAKSINQLVLGGARLRYAVDYILEPGKQYLKIVTTLTNAESREVGFAIRLPLGLVSLLGEGQKLFVPGAAGFDMRSRLEEVYARPSALDALPGEVASMVVTEGASVSYALAASPRGAGYMRASPSFYPAAADDAMLIPVASGSFLATFWATPPIRLSPGQSFSYTAYLAVGSGTVNSAQRVIFDIADPAGRQPVSTGTLSGRVREQGTGAAVDGASVVVRDERGAYVTATRSGRSGEFTAVVPEGRYRVVALTRTRSPTVAPADGWLEVGASGTATAAVELERPAALSVQVLDAAGLRLPAKVSVQGTHAFSEGAGPASFLYDLRLGEALRPTDLVPDMAGEESTRAFLERVFFLADGQGAELLRPGRYRVFVSRGPEYDLVSEDVELGPGEERALTFVLPQVLPTPGWISADLHVHSIRSADSNMPLDERVASYLAEGVDLLAATDHNVVTDLAPTIEALGATDRVRSTVGLELTTLEMGHFNAFPLRLEPGPIRHGAFDWFRIAPGPLFERLRAQGVDPARTLVQINHPRDSILGYFSAFNLGTFTGTSLPTEGGLSLDREPLPDGTPSPYAPEQLSLDFDLLEVFNGKRPEMIHSYRVPATRPPGPTPRAPPCAGEQVADCIPRAGELLLETVEVPDAKAPGGTRRQVQPVYPGVLDDYFTLLGQGRRYTAVGNSDSHGPAEEAGLPRTYVYVGDQADGSMRALDEGAVVEALRRHRAIVTNGPFVELWVDGQPVGGEVIAEDGSVRVRIRVQAAPWVDVSSVRLLRGGRDRVGQLPEVLLTLDVPPSTARERLDVTRELEGIPDHSFVLVEVRGERSLWPVYTPLQLAPVQLSDALGSLGSTFGLGGEFGAYRPQPVQPVRPLAFTNPIWVSRARAVPGARFPSPVSGPLSTSRRLGPAPPASQGAPPGRSIRDLRVLFGSLHADTD